MPRRLRFGLIDLLLVTTVMAVLFAAIRAMWNTPTFGPMLLLAIPLLLLVWLLRFAWEDAGLRREQKLRRQAAPPPQSFVPATSATADAQPPAARPGALWRRLRLASRKFQGPSVRMKFGGN